MKRLLVIVPDRLQSIAAKGEVVARYYNPGEIFDEVHLLQTNSAEVDIELIRPMVGRATCRVWNLDIDKRILGARFGWQRDAALRSWCARAISLAREIAPDLVRCHGAGFNTIAARAIRKSVGVPYVVSLHTNPDFNAQNRPLKGHLSGDEWRRLLFWEQQERLSLADADLVVPVYSMILPYLFRMGVTRWKVLYNVVDGANIKRKTSYARGERMHVLFTGRMFERKNPSNIIRAVAARPDIDITLVGDGPLRPALEALAVQCEAADRVTFIPSLQNAELCGLMSSFDVFAANIQSWGISKTVIEAMLTGLPIVVNRGTLPTPELEGEFVIAVEDSVEGYGAALSRLAADEHLRRALGERAYQNARDSYAPESAEARYADAYRELLALHA